MIYVHTQSQSFLFLRWTITELQPSFFNILVFLFTQEYFVQEEITQTLILTFIYFFLTLLINLSLKLFNLCSSLYSRLFKILFYNRIWGFVTVVLFSAATQKRSSATWELALKRDISPLQHKPLPWIGAATKKNPEFPVRPESHRCST